MKKITLLILVSLVLAAGLYAGEVNVNEARKVALHFYIEKFEQYIGPAGMAAIGISGEYPEIRDGLPVYYVFTMDPAGYVIVPAQDALPPVIGYSLTEPFGFADRPANVSYWLGQYAEAADIARLNRLEPETEVQQQWQKYLDDDFIISAARDGWGQLGPLLTTTWDQGWPYNYYCPADPAGSGGHTYAGCVATAIGQILYYYRWPDHGQGYHCYIPELHPEYGEQCADFENTWYRFNEMTDALSGLNEAVAEYLYHIGVAFEMNYDPNGSAPADWDSTTYFLRCLPVSDFIYRIDYSDSAWLALLKIELDAGRPIYYSGSPETGAGHAFVCDGYQDSAYFHFNLGWGGSSNGYYYIDNLAGFNFDQAIILPIFPDTVNFSYPLYSPGEDTITTLSGSIEDGSGPLHDYLCNTQAGWLIDPQNEMDSVSNIIVNIKRFSLFDDEDRLFIYDGADNSAPLLAELSGDTLLGPITSSGNKVFIEFITGDSNCAPGFYLNFHTTKPVWCSGWTQFTEGSATFDDGSGEFYYDNFITCMWMINPGLNEPLTIGFNYFDTKEGDFLNVYDAQTQQVLETFSGHYEVPPGPVTSPSGKIMLAFITNQEGRGQGWEATYPAMSVAETDHPLSLRVRPNPVSGTLNISYSLSEDCPVMLDLTDITGRPAGVILNEKQAAGEHTVSYDMANLNSGLYFCRMKAGNGLGVVKIIKQ